MIVSLRLMASSDEILCAGEDEYLHLNDGKTTEPEPKEQFRALSLRSSTLLQPWQSRQPCVIAVPVLNIGQSVVCRGRGREQFCKSRMPFAAKSAEYEDRSLCGILPQSTKRASREYCPRPATSPSPLKKCLRTREEQPHGAGMRKNGRSREKDIDKRGERTRCSWTWSPVRRRLPLKKFCVNGV